MPRSFHSRLNIRGPYAAAVCIALATAGTAQAEGDREDAASQPEVAAAAPITVEVPKTTLSIELVPVTMPDGSTLLVTRREIEWPLYDTYVHGLDQESPATPDDAGIVTRPTKPYINMDRGWGHANYPAMGMSHLAAQEFCTWLGHKTGRTFRLPTEAEWEAIAEQSGATPENVDARAWHLGNTNDTTEGRALKEPDDLGLYDLLGNVGEWCTTEDGKAIVRGGSYMDEDYLLSPKARQQPHRSWNSTDPQIPKSKWWLADCTWVGIRPVCVPDDPAAAEEAVSSEETATN